MHRVWFVRTRWYWYPVHAAGWCLLAGFGCCALALSAAVLAQRDGLADQLQGLILSNGFCFLASDWLARRCSYRDGRQLRRHQRDPEAWT